MTNNPSITNTEKPLVVSPKRACHLIDCSRTHLYELMNARAILSYRDGKSRKILVSSIEEYISNQLAIEAKNPAGSTAITCDGK